MWLSVANVGLRHGSLPLGAIARKSSQIYIGQSLIPEIGDLCLTALVINFIILVDGTN
jgi:hypothetical protein